MITDMTELTQSILALPVNERADLAEAVWLSLEQDEAAIDVAMQRAAEIDAGEAQLVSHEEVMRIAREAIR